MLKNYTIKITNQAQEQLHEITNYIALHLKAPDASLNLLNFLEQSIMSLNHFPQRAPLIAEEPWRSNKIRKIPAKNFLIYFWIDESNVTVHITAIIYKKREQLYLLSQIDIE